MSEHLLSNKYSWFVNSLLFIFPIVIISQKVVGDLILLILAITGLFITFFYKTSPFSVKELKTFNWLVLGYFAVICISILFSGKALELAHFISRELYFLFAPFVALAIFKARIDISVVLYGVKVGLIVLVTLMYLNAGNFDVRYSGSINANPYGLIAAILTLFSIINVCKESLVNRLITLVAFVSGVLIIIMSGTRMAWIAFVISFFFYLWNAYIRKELKCFFRLSFLLVLLSLIFSSFFQSSLIENRTLQAKQQVMAWFSGEDSTSSVAVRLEMWDASIDEIVENPSLTGIGYRNNINKTVSKHAVKESRNVIESYNHVHNTYLNHLLAEGLLGLIAIISLLFIPFKRFIVSARYYKSINSNSFAIMGVLMILMFILFGFAMKLFGDVFINAFYVFYIAILLPKAEKLSRN